VSEDAQIALTEEVDQTMARISWAENPVVTENPTVSAVAAALPYAKDWNQGLAATGEVAQIESLFKTFYESVIIGGESVEEQLDIFLEAAGGVIG
jgi:hypothetical protein